MTSIESAACPAPGTGHELPVRAGIWASVAVLAAVAMAELSRLVADVLDGTGASWSFSDVFGPARAWTPTPWHPADAWVAWESLSATPPTPTGPMISRAGQVANLLALDLSVDLLFVVGYLGLAVVLLRSSRHTLTLVGVLAGVDVGENALGYLIAYRIGSRATAPGLSVQVIGCLTWLKWVLAAAVLVGALLPALGAGAGGTRPGPASLRIVVHALWLQRFSLMALAPLALLAISPGAEPADQLPDVARSWLDGWPGPRYLAAAGVALVLVMVALLVLGRLRSDRVWRERMPVLGGVGATTPAGGRAEPVWWRWVIRGPAWLRAVFPEDAWLGPEAEPASARLPRKAPAPGLWLLACGVVGGSAALADGFGAPVRWGPSLVWAALVGLVLLGSLFAGRMPSGRRIPEYPVNEPLARVTAVTGDVLCLSAGVIGGAGLVRAFTASVTAPGSAAGPAPGQAPGQAQGTVLSVLLLMLGFVVAVGVWPLGEMMRVRLARRPDGQAGWWGYLAERLWTVLTPGEPAVTPVPGAPAARVSTRWRAGIRVSLLLVAAGLLLGLGLAPVRAAADLGMLACVELAIIAMVLVVGVTVVVSREHLPLPLFRAIGLRSTPIAALVVLGVVAVSLQTGDVTLHHVQGLVGESTATSSRPSSLYVRPGLAETFQRWLAASAACDRTTDAVVAGRPVRVRPMLLVAADGGGIRAAHWTVSAMAALRSEGGDCGAHATLLSSGVSGGSLGLALSQVTPDPASAVRDLAEQDALAAAGIGLLVRDNLAALTGVYLPSLRDRGLSAYSGRGWQDRAALMEGIWQRQVPALAGPFLADRAGSVTGPLILNSTSVGTGCRALVSQLWFPPTRGQNEAEPYDPLCRSGAAPLPASFDLIADYGGSDRRDGSHCLGGLSVATAVMLSARFAYVTPSGVVGPCHALTEQQLIDGGYAESSGLGTVVDLAGAGRALPRGQSEADGWLAHVRQHNAQAWAELTRPSGQGTATPVFIAPVVVFLQNHFRSDLGSSTSRRSNEILVPVDGKAAGAAQTATASQLQRALTLTAPDVPCAPVGGAASEVSPDCAKVREAIRTQVPFSVVVISPDTRPAVTAPLGWVLSQSSRTGLDDAMDRQKRTTCMGMQAAEPYRTSPDCQAGYGRLADLLATLS